MRIQIMDTHTETMGTQQPHTRKQSMDTHRNHGDKDRNHIHKPKLMDTQKKKIKDTEAMELRTQLMGVKITSCTHTETTDTNTASY